MKTFHNKIYILICNNNDENDEYLDYLLSSSNQSYEEFLNNLYENDKNFENSQQLKRKLGGFHACRLKLSNDQSDFKAKVNWFIQ